jgi:protein O-mannosyl-transferase
MISENSKFFQSLVGYCLIISMLGILVFANHLNNPFQFDSVPYITNNSNLKNPEALLTAEFWKQEIMSRGLLRMSIALNAHLGGFHPFGYHLLSLAFHILNTILLFFVFEKSLRHFSPNTIGWGKINIRSVSFFASILFLCHPIQTESVIYIMSRSEVMASTFYLIGFLLFQQLLERASTSRIKHLFYFIIILLIALLGFSVKQIVATLPATLTLYYFLSSPNNSPAWMFLKKWKWPLLVILLGFIGILFYKLFSDESFLVGPSRTEDMVGRVKYMLSQPSVIIFYYLKKLLFPINLNIDPDIEVVISLLSWSFLIPVFFIALSLICSFQVFRCRFIFFFLCWFFIILTPSSSIVTLHDLGAEHRSYLASAGFFILLTYGAFEIIRKCFKIQPQYFILIFFMYVGVLGILNMKRNTVWQSELSLWQDTYKKSPHKLRPLINLARAHSLLGDTDKAIKYYQEVLIKGPLIFAANYNLGDLYIKKGLVPDAVRHFLLASRISPETPETFSRLGEIYFSKNKFKLANSYFKQAVELNPHFAIGFKNLGVLNFYHLNKPKQGITYFSRSLTLDPYQAESEKIRQLLADYSGSKNQ